jgi:predicted DNA-binding WGR domain protein
MPEKFFDKNKGYGVKPVKDAVKALKQKVKAEDVPDLLKESEKLYEDALDAFGESSKDGFDTPEYKDARGAYAKAQNLWRAIRVLAEDAKTKPKSFKKKGRLELRASLIRLAHEKPELRSQILPLLVDKTVQEMTPEMRLATLQVKLAHKPILEREGLNTRAVKEGMGTMLYFIDASRNHSKFYEMLIVPSGGGYTLMRRWGALTDSGMTGRVDSKNMVFGSLSEAQAELAKIYREKTGKGYKDAHNGKMHVSPATGERLPLGQYPVGLTRTPGFGWGTQSATACIPSLRDLQEKIDSALNELEEDSDLSMLLADCEGAQRIINALMRNPQAIEYETNRSMGDILDAAMKTPLNRMRALQGIARSGPGRLPDLDRTKLRKELSAIRNYIRKQLSHCA